jgi:hypothetical protein
MCTLDTSVRDLYQEVDLILVSSASGNLADDIPRLNVVLRLLRENSDILNSLQNFQGVVWFHSNDGFIEFMPNSSCLLLISLRDLSFQVCCGGGVFLVGGSDQYLSTYAFHKKCPFFSGSDDQTSHTMEKFAVDIHQVSAA